MMDWRNRAADGRGCQINNHAATCHSVRPVVVNSRLGAHYLPDHALAEAGFRVHCGRAARWPTCTSARTGSCAGCRGYLLRQLHGGSCSRSGSDPSW